MRATPAAGLPGQLSLPWNVRGTQFTKGLSRSEANLLAFGLGIIGLYVFSFITPNFITAFIRPVYLLGSLMFCFTGFIRMRLKLPFAWPIGMGLALQVWSICTQVYASSVLGREMILGRPETYLLEAMIPFFVASVMVGIKPDIRNTMLAMALTVFSISCFVGYLQFLRVGPAMRLADVYTYKSIDNWDGTAGLRAVGLTFHPNLMAFQAVAGWAIIGSRLFTDQIRRIDVIGLFYFTGAVVVTQARLGYIVMVAAWILFLVVLFRKDRPLSMQIVSLGAALLIVAVVLGGKRLGYALQSTSPTSDSSMKYRVERTWGQLDGIYPKYALTGIGPSSGLLLGTGYEDKYVPDGRVMESGYRVVLAMYGLPGFFIFISGMLGSLYLAVRVLSNPGYAATRRRAAGVAFAAVLFLGTNCFTSNSVDGYMQLPFNFMLAGMASASTRDKVVEVVRRIRKRSLFARAIGW